MTTPRAAMRWIMATFYGLGGVGHLLLTDTFLPIVPDWVPWPRTVVIATGLCEIAGAVALLSPRYRRLAGVMLAIYAVCVFPANVKHAVEGVSMLPIPEGWWYHAPRFALQPVIVWWALFCGNVIDWPFGSRRGAQA